MSNKLGLVGFVALIFLTLTACSPKLRSDIVKTLPPLSSSDEVVVVGMKYVAIIPDSTLVGSIKVTDTGLSTECSYQENIIRLKDMAKKSGSNLILITRHQPADNWSTCDRIWANIYAVADPFIYEKEIEWTDKRRLTWNDFKGAIPEVKSQKYGAETASKIEFQYKSGMFKSGLTLNVQCRFITEKSWVRPDARNEYVLGHEQLHFDITELYARKLRKQLEEAKLTSKDQSRAMQIFDTVNEEHQKRQSYYDRVTEHGIKKSQQKEWEAMILLELARLELYKSEVLN